MLPCSAPAALAYAPPAKLPTPPKGRAAASQLQAVKVPPLKLGGVGGGGAAASSTAADENTGVNAAEVAAAPTADKAVSKGKKSGTLRFLPGRKVVRKQAVPPPGPQLAVDLPLSSRGEASAMPRLPFDVGGWLAQD